MYVPITDIYCRCYSRITLVNTKESTIILSWGIKYSGLLRPLGAGCSDRHIDKLVTNEINALSNYL